MNYIKLPVIDIKTANGNLTEWQTFYENLD